MHLVHAVLLPGIIVFVSNGILLHAGALHEDEMGVLAGRQLRAATGRLGVSSLAEEFAEGIKTINGRATFIRDREYGDHFRILNPLDVFFGELLASKESFKRLSTDNSIHQQLRRVLQSHQEGGDVEYNTVMEYLVRTFEPPELERIMGMLKNNEDGAAKSFAKEIKDYLEQL
uniref:Uncharacterized protein n=1 Tax=Peronospora matthiolae TaxID=2874970 RepID=A0AAV1VF68_9STRA